MNTQRLLLIVGIIVTLTLLFIEPYYAAIFAIIIVILIMSFRIMGETRDLPDIVVQLREDAKAIQIINRGNGRAHNIHIALVPHNLEFDVAGIEPDANEVIHLGSMLEEAKAVVSYENSRGRKFSRSYMLSALSPNDDDLLKPTFPLFSWK